MKNKLIKSIIIISLCFFTGLSALGYFFILQPKVIASDPTNNSENVSLKSHLIIKFDKPVKRKEIKISVYPEIYGTWEFQDPLIRNHLYRTLVFIPAVDFDLETNYEIKLENIKGFGLGKERFFSFNFKTELSSFSLQTETKGEIKTLPESEIVNPKIEEIKPLQVEQKKESEKPKKEITLIKIPIDWQDYPLSCEAASLKMALTFKGIYVSEDQIMGKIGYDPTSHRGNIWGDPYQKYVGNIKGAMCTSGYGVYWDPLAKAANNWREAEVLSGFGLEKLIEEISLGNPIVVWGTLPVSTLHDCSWYTPGGKYVKAYKETHVRLVVGFVGPKESPSHIILNDPLAGRIYWSTSYFLENWKSFNYSGVVIR